jgi:hypothetical protein
LEVSVSEARLFSLSVFSPSGPCHDKTPSVRLNFRGYVFFVAIALSLRYLRSEAVFLASAIILLPVPKKAGKTSIASMEIMNTTTANSRRVKPELVKSEW